MFDSLINDAREKFNLGDKADGLLSTLLALMTDETNGGFSGFLERFEEAGLGDVASSWVSSSANTPLSNEQVESVFGEGTLDDIADEVGLDYDTTTSATAFMTPHIVDNLTPDGVVPSEGDLLSRVGGFLGGIGGAAASDTINRVGTAASGTVDAGERRIAENVDMVDAGAVAVGDKSSGTLHSVGDPVDGDGDGDSILKWLIPLLLLGLVVVLGFWFCRKSPTPTVTNTNTNTNKVNTNPKTTNTNAVNANK